MDLRLSGKVAVVTGASRGIGRAIAETLASEGMNLVLVARSGDLLEELAKSIPTECLAEARDLRESGAPADVIQNAVARFNRIDVLVNNAGATERGDFLTLSDEKWSDGFALKFFGAMRCCRAAWPHLKSSSGGIINIVGIGGRTPSAEFTIGGSVNAALLNLTKALADRGLKDGVRVNAVNPGSIATERLQKRIERFASEHSIDREQATQLMAKEMGVSRFGDPSEIARAVAFLASPQSDYCHGAILDVDGGQTRTL
ncbi:MAG: SDR family oxidoreductase [Blastocatellia bacterium]